MFSFFFKKREQVAAAQRQTELAKQQEDLVKCARDALEAAAQGNPVHRKQYGDTGPLQVSVLGATVYVFASGIDTGAGMRRDDRYVVLNFSIDVLNRRLHRLLGCYGPEDDFPIDMFDEALGWASAHVREWRLYPDIAA